MKTVKRFDVMSVAKVAGATYGCMSLIFVPFLLLFSVGMLASGQKGVGMIGGVGGVVFAVAIPFIYAVMGFLMGALMAWLYNLVASKFGGIQVEIE